jgi:hypothetical protein
VASSHEHIPARNDEVMPNGRRRILSINLDGENDGEVKYLVMKLKNRLRSQGIDVDSWVVETKGRIREVKEAWRR